MKLAKERIDVGFFTNRLEAMLAFYQGDVGLPFEELLPLGGGARQHRHGLNGSVFKLNESRDVLPAGPRPGYRELLIARDGLTEPRHLVDPDGNNLTLVPPGHEGISGIGVRLGVCDPAAFRDFYGRVMGIDALGDDRYRCGDSVISFAAVPDASADGALRCVGFRYLTLQVWDVETEHATLIGRGALEGRTPATIGSTARISFIRDPDGNWIEISQRASLTGPLHA